MNIHTSTCSECGSRANTCDYVVANVEEITATIAAVHDRAEKAEARVAELETAIRALPCNQYVWCKPGHRCAVHGILREGPSVSTVKGGKP